MPDNPVRETYVPKVQTEEESRRLIREAIKRAATDEADRALRPAL